MNKQAQGILMATFEESLQRLEKIVANLEQGELSLAESIQLFEEGMRLSMACKLELDEAEGKIQVLVKQRDGSHKAEPFSVEG